MLPATIEALLARRGADAPDEIDIQEFPTGFFDFLWSIHERVEPARRAVLDARAESRVKAAEGVMPAPSAGGEARRASWRVELPAWARDLRNVVQGPANNPRALIEMLNSGAQGCIPDAEDGLIPEWRNLRSVHYNAVASIQGTLTYSDPATGALERARPSTQAVFYRPRGIHLWEARLAEGRPISASVYHLTNIVFRTIGQRQIAQDGPMQAKLGFCAPKIESAEEAAWWSDTLAALEQSVRIPVGSTKLLLTIESLPAAYRVEEILHACRRHAIGLILGRQDLLASMVEFRSSDRSWIMPDLESLPEDLPLFEDLRRRVVDVCHRRGALSIGGMLDGSRGAELDAAAGFDGCRTRRAEQSAEAARRFPNPNRLDAVHPDLPAQADLYALLGRAGRVTEAWSRRAIRVLIEYRFGVASNLGARLIEGRVMDLSADRLRRAMLAQRLSRGVHAVADVRRWFSEELADVTRSVPDVAARARYEEARRVAEGMLLDGMPDPSFI